MDYKIDQNFYDIIDGREVEITDIHLDKDGNIEGFSLKKGINQWFSTIRSFQEYYRACQ
ncbi:hypothetical protein [Paenibacillus chitinolyticus]|uniref:Uncharacterized protein n=1 Tax=Paenibacillus chitinolyticus TaxID=79263 RepID=A0ABT4FMT0_9BACL|nr:hypothetical protein [Paenibacillus chitinolyticus]MCY9592372.1 hypothetical protein [Paenibacillus chitinolyticus]MCY9599833.1 hypothetical protein [Paenibacillus chitinolyticus]